MFGKEMGTAELHYLVGKVLAATEDEKGVGKNKTRKNESEIAQPRF